MTETNFILGKKLRKVNYSFSLDGYDDYSDDSKAEFEYLPIGALQKFHESD